LFIPSIFYKTSTLNRSSSIGEYSGDFPSSGWGFDFLFKLKSNVGFYAGTSVFGGYLRSELGTNYKSDFIIIDLRYFINDYTNTFYTGGIFFNQITFGKVNGLGVNVNFNYWKFILESNSSYYTTRSNKLIGVPDYQTQTGIYFKDILFDNNLDLKTGFVFYYIGKNNVFTYENDLVEVPSSSKLDFTLAGEIQKSAIVYFTWQNLFNNNYYLTPYYPMPGRSIRFGVAWEMFN
jgi:outer membrane cobalamin receptor